MRAVYHNRQCLLHVFLYTMSGDVLNAESGQGERHLGMQSTLLRLIVCGRRSAAVETGRQHHVLADAWCSPRLKVVYL